MRVIFYLSKDSARLFLLREAIVQQRMLKLKEVIAATQRVDTHPLNE
jgi:hypothetical protein